MSSGLSGRRQRRTKGPSAAAARSISWSVGSVITFLPAWIPSEAAGILVGSDALPSGRGWADGVDLIGGRGDGTGGVELNRWQRCEDQGDAGGRVGRSQLAAVWRFHYVAVLAGRCHPGVAAAVGVACRSAEAERLHAREGQ